MKCPAVKYFALSEANSHSLISQTCLAYLLQFDTDWDTLPSTSPLVQYAAHNWILHVQSGSTDESKSLPTLTLILNLFEPGCCAFTNWARVFDSQLTWPNELPGIEDIGSPLSYAAQGGLERVVHHLLEKGVDVNAQGGRYGNGLQAASYEGHGAIVRLLLEKGADVNAQGGQYGNALQAASSRGRDAIVNLLLEKGADVNARGGQYGNALQAASYEGHGAIVKLILDRKSVV